MKIFVPFLKKTRLRQLLTIFLAGIVFFSVLTAYKRSLLHAKTLDNSEIDIPIYFQPQSSQELSTENSLNSDIKLAAGFTDISWRNATASPLARAESEVALVDGKMYLFGGYLQRPFRVIDTVDMYDPATDRWRRIPTKMPNPLTHSGTAAAGRDIYLAGGYIGTPQGRQIFATRDVWRYNIDANTWRRMPQLPAARGGGGLVVLNGNLHFFGGSDINRADTGDHWVLALNGGTRWTPSASLPNPRNHIGTAQLDGKIYAIGGQKGQDAESITQNSVHMWNPATRRWQPVASLPRARSHISGATFVMDGRIIVAGGETSHTIAMRDVTAYDPALNSWTALTPIPAPRRSGAARGVRGKIFYTTGYNTTTYAGSPMLVSSNLSP